MTALNATLVALNAKYVHTSLAPWYLVAALGHLPQVRCRVIEGTVNEPQAGLLQRLLETKPDLVGISCYIWNWQAVKALLPLLRQALPGVPFVLGGPQVSYQVEQVLADCPEVDFIIAGEGELPFAQLAQALCQGHPPTGIPGLCTRQKRVPPYVSRETPPDPYSEAYFANLKGRLCYLETSRGCPFSCAFCLSGRCGAPRFFPLAQAKAQLLKVANGGSKTIKLVDRTFNANPERAQALVAFIVAHYGKGIPVGVCFHFEIAGDILTPGLLAALASCPPGAVQLEIGLQSFCAKALAAVQRKTDIQKLTANIAQLLQGGNLHVHLDLIAGLPEEDLPEFRRSFATALSLRPHMLQLGFLKILPGSPMGDAPDQFPCTHSALPPYEVQSTPWLSSADLVELKGVESALDRLYNSGRFQKSLDYLLESWEPYALFLRFAQAAGPLNGQSLLQVTERFWTCFCAESPRQLRDKLVEDWLSHEPKLPRFLHGGEQPGKRLAQLAHQIPLQKGVRRAAAFLPTENQWIYVDYTEKHPVTGCYPIKRVKTMP